jgi:hypothetical protein
VEPDVEISARARARELTFHETPEVSESARAEPGGESVVGGHRENLPARVETGVTYRDIRIDHRLAARLD